MDRNELPKTKADRVDWVIRAGTNEEMQRRYDLWAKVYDSDIGSYDDYLVPREAAKVAKRVLKSDARIFDAGAGTGLVGQALADAGFKELIAVDYSAKMLEVARSKGVYKEIHQSDLGRVTGFQDSSFDAVITCGTTSQMPSFSLNEFVRVVRSGGHIIFAVIPEAWVDCGYAEVYSKLNTQGKVVVEERGAPFQMMPTTEADFYCEIWTMKVFQGAK